MVHPQTSDIATRPAEGLALSPALYDALRRDVFYGQILSGMVHNVRNPLQTLGLAAQAFSDDFDEDLLRRLSGSIERSAEALADTVSLLNRVVSSPRQAEGPVLLQDVFTEVARLQSHHRIAISGELVLPSSADLPPVRGAQRDLEDVFHGLVSNAKEAIGLRQKGTVTITASAHSDRVSVTVHDTGRGLSPEAQDRAGEPFYTTKDRRQHRGLGLTLIRFILQLTGGMVRLAAGENGTAAVVDVRRWRG